MRKSRSSKKHPGFSIAELHRFVKRGVVQPCYLFVGPEQFTADEAVALLRDSYIPEEQRSFNFDVMYGHEISAHEVVALASSYPMMGEKRIVVIKEFDKLTNPDQLTSYIKNPLESTILILISDKPDLRKNPYRVFDGKNTLACTPLYDNQVPDWVMERVKRYNKTIAEDVADMLSAYTGTSMRQISNELDKLDIYTGDRKEITADDVSAVVGVSKEYSVFELCKAVGFKDTSNAVKILDRMIESGESPVYIVVMLNRLFKQIAIILDLRSKNVPDQKIMQELKISPFFFKDYLSYIHHHPVQSIPDRFKALLEADVLLKTTGKDNRLVLTMLLFRLMDKNDATVKSVEEYGEEFSD